MVKLPSPCIGARIGVDRANSLLADRQVAPPGGQQLRCRVPRTPRRRAEGPLQRDLPRLPGRRLMAVDVVSRIEIARPRAEVAAYACDPDTVTEWYENIKAVEWRTQPPLAV